GSSVVEQGTHKPLVGSSTLPPGRFLWRGSTFSKAQKGTILVRRSKCENCSAPARTYTHTTKRLGETLELVASKEFATFKKACRVERILKAKKNPRLSIYYLQS